MDNFLDELSDDEYQLILKLLAPYISFRLLKLTCSYIKKYFFILEDMHE